MSRYIDADLYIEYLIELKESAEKHFKHEEAYRLSLEINRIKCFPSAVDVQKVKYGQPVKMLNDAISERAITICSCCGGRISKNYTWCKHCGAKMDKECKDG